MWQMCWCNACNLQPACRNVIEYVNRAGRVEAHGLQSDKVSWLGIGLSSDCSSFDSCITGQRIQKWPACMMMFQHHRRFMWCCAYLFLDSQCVSWPASCYQASAKEAAQLPKQYPLQLGLAYLLLATARARTTLSLHGCPRAHRPNPLHEWRLT